MAPTLFLLKASTTWNRVTSLESTEGLQDFCYIKHLHTFDFFMTLGCHFPKGRNWANTTGASTNDRISP